MSIQSAFVIEREREANPESLEHHGCDPERKKQRLIIHGESAISSVREKYNRYNYSHIDSGTLHYYHHQIRRVRRRRRLLREDE
jgi:hypothetical protein